MEYDSGGSRGVGRKIDEGHGGKEVRRAVPLRGAVNCCGFWTR